MLVIVAPLYIPLVAKLDLGMAPGDALIWYGILYTITCQVAYITPPFGYNLFLMRAMAPDHVSLADIYRSIVPITGFADALELLPTLLAGELAAHGDEAMPAPTQQVA